MPAFSFTLSFNSTNVESTLLAKAQSTNYLEAAAAVATNSAFLSHSLLDQLSIQILTVTITMLVMPVIIT